MVKLIAGASLAVVLAAVFLGVQSGKAARSAASNGRIAFDRADPKSEGDTFIFTANPDGSNERRLVARHSCCPSWSHDGRRLAMPAKLKGEQLTTAIVRADGQGYMRLQISDPTLSVACAGGAWSADDKQLACESWDDAVPARNGIYIRSSANGSNLERLTSNPGGGDLPGSYSPDGKRLVFSRFDKNGNSLGLFVINGDGSDVRRLTPAGTIMQGGNTGDWSPRGNEIVFSRKASVGGPGSIWIIRSDGTHLRRITVKGLACGSNVGCHGPRWSPDGKKIVFAANNSTTTNIYVALANGTGLVQVTRDGHSDDPSWGSRR